MDAPLPNGRCQGLLVRIDDLGNLLLDFEQDDAIGMRGRIFRITPVERMSMVLTTGVFEFDKSVAVLVVTGIWLPTSSRAG